MSEAATTETEREQARDLVARAEQGDAVAVAQLEARDRSLAAQQAVEDEATQLREEDAAYRASIQNADARTHRSGVHVARNSKPEGAALRAQVMVDAIEACGGDVVQIAYGVNQQGHAILVQYIAPVGAVPGLRRQLVRASSLNTTGSST